MLQPSSALPARTGLTSTSVSQSCTKPGFLPGSGTATPLEQSGRGEGVGCGVAGGPGVEVGLGVGVAGGGRGVAVGGNGVAVGGSGVAVGSGVSVGEGAAVGAGVGEGICSAVRASTVAATLASMVASVPAVASIVAWTPDSTVAWISGVRSGCSVRQAMTAAKTNANSRAVVTRWAALEKTPCISPPPGFLAGDEYNRPSSDAY